MTNTYIPRIFEREQPGRLQAISSIPRYDISDDGESRVMAYDTFSNSAVIIVEGIDSRPILERPNKLYPERN